MDRNTILKLNNFLFKIAEKDQKQQIIFFRDKKNFTLSGNSVQDILKIIDYLDGNFNIDDIHSSTNLDINYIIKIAEYLKEKGIIKTISNKNPLNPLNIMGDLKEYLIETSNQDSEHLDWDMQNVSSLKIYIDDLSMYSQDLTKILNQYFIVTDEMTSSDLLLCIDDFENELSFKKVNDISIKYKIPFLKGVISKDEISIGPFFTKDSLCYNCYLSRYKSNLFNPKKDWELYQEFHKKNKTSKFPGINSTFYSLLLTTLIKYASNIMDCTLLNKEFIFNPINYESNLYTCLKIPGCESCGRRQ